METNDCDNHRMQISRKDVLRTAEEEEVEEIDALEVFSRFGGRSSIGWIPLLNRLGRAHCGSDAYHTQPQ